MTIAVFDLTEFTQFAIKYNTGMFPDKFAMTVYMSNDSDYDRPVEERPSCSLNACEICDWDRAVQLAEWILEHDRLFKSAERHKESLKMLSEDD